MTYKVFRDAVHNMISLHRETEGMTVNPVDWGDALLLDLIDTPEMQRLRRISQLGPASQVYPSAEHSRFSHALGTMHLAKRILATVLSRPDPPLDRETIVQVKVAALLHDIGHGPYSHVFELIVPNWGGHEVLGWRMVDRDGPLRQTIIRHCHRLNIPEDRFLLGLHTMLSKGDTSGNNSFGRQVISSQLDADRMDYLLRDAHFTGVSYGQYDLEWLLHSFRACRVGTGFRLCVEISKGPSALESYVVARDHMYRQVYDHKTVRAFEVLMVHLFQLLQWRWDEEGGPPAETPAALLRCLETIHSGSPISIVDYLALDDAVLDCAIGQWAEQIPQSPLDAELRWKSRLLRDRKPIYRRLLWQFSHSSQKQDPLSSGETRWSEQIHDAEIADAVDGFFQKKRQTRLTVRYPDGTLGTLPLYLLVQVDRLERAPYAHLQYTTGKADPILTIEEGGGYSSKHTMRPAEHASALINQLGGSRRKLARVFVDPRVLSDVEDLVRCHFYHPNVEIASTS